MRTRTLLVVAGLCAMWAGGAQAGEPLRVLVLESERDAALVARVEGQLADLAVTLERAGRAMPAAVLPAQLAAARRAAYAHGADAVVWFAHDGDGWIVHVAEAGGERVLVRRVQAPRGAMGSSAAIEAAAMIVRTAVRGLAAGGEIGVAAERIVEPAPAAAPPAVAVAAVRGDGGAVRPLRPTATIAWSGIVDGEASAGHHGITARLGVAGGPWHVAAAAAHHPATTHRGAMATITVERQRLGMVLGLDVAGGARRNGGGRWRVGLEATLAMTRFARTTTLTDPAVEPTADRATWTPSATPAVRVARRLAGGAWIELAVGAELVAHAPEFGVATPSGFATLARLWPAQPQVGLGVVVDPF